MPTKLLIVESPAKAKTIEKFLGKDFKVKSSYGHIRDLDKGSKGIDIDNKFKPNYIISPEKVKVVKDLKDTVKKVDEVWLATDEDREGEAISWHLCEVLGLSPKNVKRIVFREITKPAIQAAVQAPRNIDLDLVNAQQARRVLDRLVGFELSEILWKKVKNKLSAGRVQSVAVKLIVDREREIHDFKSDAYFKIDGLFSKIKSSTPEIKAGLNDRFSSAKEAEDFLNICKKSTFKVSNIEVKPVKRNPAPPFTTSTLQQEASRKLGFSVNRTMSTAQKLYEAGFISYMRTDSTSLSPIAISAMAQEIEQQFGANYVQTRQYKTKNSNAQEAHEAIRPTYMNMRVAGENSDQQRLYELIWKRALASQMAPAELEKTSVQINISETQKNYFVAEGEVLLFEGFLKLYLESTDEESEEKEGILPSFNVGEILNREEISATERFTRPLARFTEASLVKKLEELGIGRPSTYAPTISKIMEADRGYVVKESREGVDREYLQITLLKDKISKSKLTEKTGTTKNVLYPTAIGMVVTDYLEGHFSEIINYGFTAEIEKDFDEIAEGKRNWIKMLDEFYWPFHKDVEKVLETGERAKGRRDLGIDPNTGRKVIAQLTRFGPVVQIGDVDELLEDEKPRFANLRPGQSLENISFDEAMDLFQLPKNLGEYEGMEVVVAVGRFGPYIKHGEGFISIPKGVDPMVVDMSIAAQIIEAKKKEDAPIGYFKELPITKGSGRFGPFVKWNGIFVNVPRRINIQSITEEEAVPLIEAKEIKEANRYIHQWEEEKISVENGRWGPFIKFKKKIINIPKINEQRVTAEMAATLDLEYFKKIIEDQIPGAFTAKTKSKSKSSDAKLKNPLVKKEKNTTVKSKIDSSKNLKSKAKKTSSKK
ncbi:MAG: type I DNA topoisomerase [Saprospiraceae bacterium]|nr:type I DNA topoisomerase [Saprospiraceae bacterium]